MSTEKKDPFVAIPVPVIIERERFLRIASRRIARSPRKTPPLHVTPRTLLTGICRCGYCQSPMHITTGKGGRYRYLKCNRRGAISRSICISPNVPYERFEKLILRNIAEHVLTEDALKTVLKNCGSQAKLLAATQGSEYKKIKNSKVLVERKLNNLYKLIEDEKVRIDDSLRARIRLWQDELDELSEQQKSIKTPVAIPASVVNSIDVASFRAAALEIIADPNSEEAKAFMHLVVQEIRIYKDDASVSGPDLGLLEAALKQQRVTVPTVPSFVRNWRRGRDSNPCAKFP